MQLTEGAQSFMFPSDYISSYHKVVTWFMLTLSVSIWVLDVNDLFREMVILSTGDMSLYSQVFCCL